jgi:penicillin-binding protein 1A
MKQAIGDSPVLQFRVPDGITLDRYNTGMGTTVDAFKDGQVPGQSSGLGAGTAVDANNMTLGPEDTGAEVDANIPPPESGGGATISASSGDASRPAGPAPARASAAGSDIGVGGVY